MACLVRIDESVGGLARDHAIGAGTPLVPGVFLLDPVPVVLVLALVVSLPSWHRALEAFSKSNLERFRKRSRLTL